MRHARAVSILFLFVLMAAVAFSGCSEDDPLAPFEPEVNNTADTFQLQATGVTNRTATLNYGWVNTQGQANIDHSTVTTAGSARLFITDADGTGVYDADLLPSLNEDTVIGSTGTWTITLILDGFSGTLNFRAQAI